MLQDMSTAPDTAEGIRARTRRELVAAIKAAAHRQLATSGAAGLSLRAIARDLHMASSALYRYFASRDDLLTALVIDAYNDLGEPALAASTRAGTSTTRGARSALVGRHAQDEGVTLAPATPERGRGARECCASPRPFGAGRRERRGLRRYRSRDHDLA